MANPQLEDGFTRIANELLDALLRQRLSGHEIRILLLIIRKTYGFNKKEDYISLSQMAKLTGLSRTRCSQISNSLESKRVLTVTEKYNGKVKRYKLNKDFEQWITPTKKCTGIRKVKSTITEKCNHKRQYTKDNTYSKETIELTNLLAEKILANNPKHRFLSDEKRDATIRKWADPIDKLQRVDKQSMEDIRDVIEWCQTDKFWKMNILSGYKLRKQWDTLYPKMKTKRDKEAWRE